MNIALIIQDSENGKIYDVSDITSGIQWVTELREQPGKLTFNVQSHSDMIINEGSRVSFKVNDTGVFFGYIFKREKSKDNTIKITAYDQMRYLKNKATYVFSNVTSSDIFIKICKDYNLQYGTIDQNNYILAQRVYDNKTLFEIIQWSIDETLAYNGNWFIIRDNFGQLEYRNLNSLKTDVFIGDRSSLTDFTHSSSIDEDTYNQVKLLRENKQTKKRDTYIVKDSFNINKWGLLEYYEIVNEDANEAQIAERAQNLLKVKNRATKSLKCECLGDLKVFAGCSVFVGIDDLIDQALQPNRYFVVTSCTHTFDNNNHTMSLDLQVTV